MENNNLNQNEESNLENNIVTTENTIKENKKNNILFIVIISILLLAIGGYFILSKVLVEDNQTKEKENQEKYQEQETEETKEKEVLNYTLNIYKNSIGDICEYNENYCKDLAFTIKTKTENAKLIKGQDAFVLYEDDGLRIYNNYDGSITKLNLENQYKNYSIHYDNDKILGIVYYNEDEQSCKYSLSGYYNIKNGQKIYDNKYSYIHTVSNSSYLTAALGDSIYLLNSETEKVELSSIQKYNHNGEICYIMGGYMFKSYSNNNKSIYYITDADEFNVYKFYSNDKKIILDKEIVEGNWSFKDKYLYVIDGEIIKKYDMDGSLNATKTIGDVKGLLENYAIYVENGNLSLKNIDSDKTIVLDKWNENYVYDKSLISGVYSRERLDSMGEKDKPEGVYVVVYYKEKDSNDNYGMEYCYTKTGEIKTFAIKHEQGGRAKPVLYLYPSKTTDIKVEFAHPEYLTTTYPKYDNVWEVTAYPNGDLYDKDNKYYYGLYWDEIRYSEVDFHEGFYVTKENAINFLEEKLNIIGLNPKERNEFIMYWLPILENNGKSIVYFELTKERERDNKLIITPKPDSILRVSIHIKKVNDYVNIKEQKLATFKRQGFTVVEWGGMTY